MGSNPPSVAVDSISQPSISTTSLVPLLPVSSSHVSKPQFSPSVAPLPPSSFNVAPLQPSVSLPPTSTSVAPLHQSAPLPPSSLVVDPLLPSASLPPSSPSEAPQHPRASSPAPPPPSVTSPASPSPSFPSKAPLPAPRSPRQKVKAVGAWKAALTAQQEPLRVKPSSISLVDGIAHVVVPEDILSDQTPLWKDFVVGHFLGEVSPHIGKVHATVNRLWQNHEGKIKIDAQFLSQKTVLFRIPNDLIRTRVLRRHCWHISDVPLVVQQWCPSSANAKPNLSSLPIWVDFKNVPDNLFTKNGIMFLGDTIGVAQRLHPNTERCTRFDIARVLVEVNLNLDLPKSICIQSNPEAKISVSYPWLPSKCSLCSVWGHNDKECDLKHHEMETCRTLLKQTEAAVPQMPSGQTPAYSETDKEVIPAEYNNLADAQTQETPEADKEVTLVTPKETPAISEANQNVVTDVSIALPEELNLVVAPLDIYPPSEKTGEPEENRGLDAGVSLAETGGNDTQSAAQSHDEQWILVSRNRKSPGSNRMMKGKMVDPSPSLPLYSTGMDAEEDVIQNKTLPSSSTAVDSVKNYYLDGEDLVKENRKTRRSTKKIETRQNNSKKSSSRKA